MTMWKREQVEVGEGSKGNKKLQSAKGKTAERRPTEESVKKEEVPGVGPVKNSGRPNSEKSPLHLTNWEKNEKLSQSFEGLVDRKETKQQ